ncbi:ribonuclease H-like domain-containing protein [Gorillibacterium sp. sgz5001074]|uniref:ribonuclease H-like domain-containing protein n=1 Tax=Gorillibacterium sp. sgz5001074 TaxID=3446695 RepID=UPI003F6702DC
MSGLKDRLKRLTGSGGGTGTPQPSVAEEQSSAGGEEELRSGGNEAEAPLAEEALDAEWHPIEAALVRSDWGSFIRRRRVYPPDYIHGEYVLSDLKRNAAELAAFHPGESVSCRDLLFFDTETTGLGVGAGNVPFMIGIGFWEENGGFAVEQFFIRNPAEELAMLAYLKPLMERYPFLVSYNGRSFDWPLLKNRFVMNRMKEGIAEPRHFDFLYPSRALWKNTLPSCRLGKVEEARLGFHRVDDVPGSMAPTLYFQYLAENRPDIMAPVFLHNEMDLLSLAGLAVLFADALAGRLDTEAYGPEEQFRLGTWLHRMGKEALSRRILRDLEPASGRFPVEADYLYLPLAAHFKQIGDWQAALALWKAAIQKAKMDGAGGMSSLEPYIELSMHYEHREKDFETALHYAEEALLWVEEKRTAFQSVLRRSRLGGQSRVLSDGGEETAGRARKGGLQEAAADLEKRVLRLRSKLAKAAQPKTRSARLPRPESVAGVQPPMTLF